MKTVRLGKTEIIATKTAFGALPIMRVSMDEARTILRAAYDAGINYFDTARMYTDSEDKIGYSLSDVRSNIFLATKSKALNAADMEKELHTSLMKMKTDYIDVYQIHNAPFCPKPDGADGIYSFMEKAKKQGKIRHIGITSHREHVALAAIESGLYETLQYPYAYLSGERERAVVEKCLAADMGYIAMKPFAGGALQNAAAVYSFFAKEDGVVPIYGIQKLSELEEILSFEKTPPNAETVEGIIAVDRKELSGNFCRNCGYCLPCPVGIEVDAVSRSYHNLRRMPHEMTITPEWKAKMEKTVECIGCGSCSSKCPYELDPPSKFAFLLKDYLDQYELHCKK